jgi:hypothetical protein
MGVMSSIGSFAGKLLGTDKAIESVINHSSNAIDKLIYTSEEKADAVAADRTEFRRMIVDWMANTQGQNLARRLIALVITSIWVLQYLSMMTLSLVSVWVNNPNQFIASSKVIGEYAESMNGAMMLILGFYFAAPHLGKIAEGALNKFGGGKR